MFNKQLSLQQQVHIDLTMRARGGIIIYIVIWLITALWSGMAEENPFFFYLNTFIITSIAFMRIIHYQIFIRRTINTHRMYSWLVFLILIGALHWGVLSVWVIFEGSNQVLHYPYMIILSAFTIGGTIILSISRTIRIYYPLFVAIPTLISCVVVGGGENYVLAILLILALFYVFEVSRISSKDYQDAITSRREADERAKQMELLSITDQLTGLHNRMYFSKSYSHEWKRCSRLKIPLSVLLIDLDHFKPVNDNYGHLAGDECLRKVAKVLSSVMQRETDVVARYGGEEFVIILPELSLELSTDFARKIVKDVAGIDFFWEGNKINITCSIGLAYIVPNKYIDSLLLLKAADDAMYEAKDKGRNQYFISQDCLQATSL